MANYIYRVQNAEGKGCYRELGSQYWAESDHDDAFHPMPHEDGIDIDSNEFLPSDWLFGFRTKQQLHIWFTDNELSNLAEHGYYPKRCRGTVIKDGYHQCIFIPE